MCCPLSVFAVDRQAKLPSKVAPEQGCGFASFERHSVQNIRSVDRLGADACHRSHIQDARRQATRPCAIRQFVAITDLELADSLVKPERIFTAKIDGACVE